MNRRYLTLLLAALYLVACREQKAAPIKHPPVPPEERAVSITAKPVFKRHEAGKPYQYDTLEAPEDRSIPWPDTAPKPEQLDADRSYRFDLLEEKNQFGGSRVIFWFPEIHRIFDGDKQLFDASICERHQTTMDRKLVRIRYGMPAFSKEQLEHMGTNSPHSGVSLGGCCLDPDHTETHMWVCSDCVTERDRLVKECIRNMERDAGSPRDSNR